MKESAPHNWIDEWLALMADVTISPSKIEAAHQLKNANLPSKIYKFRAVNKGSLNNFENDTVWLCSANEYNDPYDCVSTFSSRELLNLNLPLVWDKLVEQTSLEKFLDGGELEQIRGSSQPLEKFFDLMLIKYPEVGGESYSHEEKKDVLFQAIDRYYDSFLSEHFAFTQKSTKVCSFSTRLNSVVMWGHYAANQTGFCLEYDINNWPSGSVQRRRLFPVIYSEHLFDITKYIGYGLDGSTTNNLFATISGMYKALDWKYEDEWRFILPMGEGFKDQNVSVPKPSAIYLGARVSAEDEATLSRIARDKDISIFKMKLSPRKFLLEPHLL